MGWASGSRLADKIWKILDYREMLERLEIGETAKLVLELVKAFESEDCDTMYECDFVKEYLNYNDDTDEWEIKR